MALDAYNVAAQIADYSLLGSLKLNEAGVILSGFSEVTPALLEGFLNNAQQLPTLSSRGELPLDYERGVQLLSSLSAEQIQNWLVQLAQALQEGRFDLVYGQLLQQEGGFRQLRDGIRYLLPRSRATLEQAKQLIRSLAEEAASATEP